MSVKTWTDLAEPVIDVQPAFNLLAVATDTEDRFPPEVKAFARYKVQEAIRQMSGTIKTLKAGLGENS
jgi:hypothetical protein